ncbi:MAG: class I SAM-dependent methyltransferase [Gammaproteobacteria bacterium]|nr:class I SAM-dependent methyltransferase [Gammaproteobacteria bacterium]
MKKLAEPSLFRGENFSKWRIGANVLTHRRQRSCIQALLDEAERMAPPTRVLDCPSGAGRMVDLLLRWQVTCADITDGRLEDIRAYFPGHDIRTVACDLFDLPFADDEFDLVLCCSLVQHIDKGRLPAMFAELRRVTSRWLIATYPTRWSLANLYGIVRGRRKTTLSVAEFDRLIGGVGLQRVRTRYVLPGVAGGKVVLLEKV